MRSITYTSDDKRSIFKTVDWWIIICYLLLVFSGLLNIYASVHADEASSILDFDLRSGKQFIWIMVSVVVAAVLLLLVPPKVFDTIAPFLYAVTIVLLVAVIFFGGEVKGSHSWFKLGVLSFQPAEVSKIATSLMLASFMGRDRFKMEGRNFWITVFLILLPMLIIVAEKETGSALVYVGFVFMMYREGLSGWFIALIGLAILLFIMTIVASPFVSILILLGITSLFVSIQNSMWKWWIFIAIPLIVANCFIPQSAQQTVILIESILYSCYLIWQGWRGKHQTMRFASLATIVAGIILIFSADYLFHEVLKDYQRARIEVLLNMKDDLSGAGYNVNQSKIAIGSGGFFGKGFCQGTQTAYGYVPEQSTDFIFCTVGEEWGFIGCLLIIALYVIIITRILMDSEHSRENFTRIYGYCLAGCLFMHLFINIGMTLGLMPVIGIPLPFLSYGGSSMLAFTTMLFIFVALDKNERKYF